VETDCTDDFSWEKPIEKTILRVLGSSDFSHSMERGDPYAVSSRGGMLVNAFLKQGPPRSMGPGVRRDDDKQ
jgi:hypothetical protein